MEPSSGMRTQSGKGCRYIRERKKGKNKESCGVFLFEDSSQCFFHHTGNERRRLPPMMMRMVLVMIMMADTEQQLMDK
jgi:hypothetical protein